jgi:hypothetical protein
VRTPELKIKILLEVIKRWRRSEKFQENKEAMKFSALALKKR